MATILGAGLSIRRIGIELLLPILGGMKDSKYCHRLTVGLKHGDMPVPVRPTLNPQIPIIRTTRDRLSHNLRPSKFFDRQCQRAKIAVGAAVLRYARRSITRLLAALQALLWRTLLLSGVIAEPCVPRSRESLANLRQGMDVPASNISGRLIDERQSFGCEELIEILAVEP